MMRPLRPLPLPLPLPRRKPARLMSDRSSRVANRDRKGGSGCASDSSAMKMDVSGTDGRKEHGAAPRQHGAARLPKEGCFSCTFQASIIVIKDHFNAWDSRRPCIPTNPWCQLVCQHVMQVGPWSSDNKPPEPADGVRSWCTSSFSYVVDNLCTSLGRFHSSCILQRSGTTEKAKKAQKLNHRKKVQQNEKRKSCWHIFIQTSGNRESRLKVAVAYFSPRGKGFAAVKNCCKHSHHLL